MAILFEVRPYLGEPNEGHILMTKKEFEQLLEEYFQWAGSHDRPKASWLLSLETWASMKYAEDHS